MKCGPSHRGPRRGDIALGRPHWSGCEVPPHHDTASFPTLALSLFLMAVNIKTPVVVENITLMCLRILQKLIKPPAPTSKKNKVLGKESWQLGRQPHHAAASSVPCPKVRDPGEGSPLLSVPQFRDGLGFLRRKISQRKVKKNKYKSTKEWNKVINCGGLPFWAVTSDDPWLPESMVMAALCLSFPM